MRNFFIVLVVVAAGYLAWVGFQSTHSQTQKETAPPPKVTSTAPAAEYETVTPEVLPPAAQTPPETSDEPPGFKSKIAITPESAKNGKHMAPIGVYYMLKRYSTETNIGVRAIVPGEPVKLLKRMGDGILRVTDGKAEFTVPESQVTNDLDIARKAEVKHFKEVQAKPKSDS